MRDTQTKQHDKRTKLIFRYQTTGIRYGMGLLGFIGGLVIRWLIVFIFRVCENNKMEKISRRAYDEMGSNRFKPYLDNCDLVRHHFFRPDQLIRCC